MYVPQVRDCVFGPRGSVSLALITPMIVPLPFTHDRLSKALERGCHFKEIVLTQREVGDLCLPTGALVACDLTLLSSTNRSRFRCHFRQALTLSC